MGSQPGMRNRKEIERTAGQLSEADAVMVTPGILRYCIDLFARRDAPTLMMLLDWQNISRDASQLGYKEGAATLLGSLERAAASGVDGVMTYLYLGYEDPKQEAEEIRRNVEVREACERLGLVHMIESRAVRSETLPDGSYDPDLVQLHARMACEIGADFVKVKYTGSVDSFRQVTSNCPCPVLIAGGRMTDDLTDAPRLAQDAVSANAGGIVFGRNIYQRSDPKRALAEFRRVVHGE